jgi:hypothetical protein
MGQRLVINIKDGSGDTFATAYYHWGAYTMSALGLVWEAIEDYFDSFGRSSFKSDSRIKKVSAAVNMLVATGGALYDRTRNYLDANRIVLPGIKEDAFKAADRSNGLIAVDEASIKEFNGWSEGTVNINIDDECFDFSCLTFPTDLNDLDSTDTRYLIENVLDIEDFSPNMAEKLIDTVKDELEEYVLTNSYDLSSVPFDDTFVLMAELNRANTYFSMPDKPNVVYTIIE